MPRYHFGSVDGYRDPDKEGTELPDDAAARTVAMRYAGEVLESDPAMLCDSGQWRVEVTDDDGRLVFTVITLAIPALRPERVVNA